MKFAADESGVAEVSCGGGPDPLAEADGEDSEDAAPGTAWSDLPHVILYKVRQILERDSYSVLAMNLVCRNWHLGLKPIYRPRYWLCRSSIFGVRIEYISWALHCCWLDPAGALTLASRLGDIRFMESLKRHLSHVHGVWQLRGQIGRAHV